MLIIKHPSLALEEVCIDARVFSTFFVRLYEINFETVIANFHWNIFTQSNLFVT